MIIISIIYYRLNPLSLVQICMPIVDQFKDNDEALQFVEKLGEKIKAYPEAFALSKVLEGKIQLDRYKNIEKTKVKIYMYALPLQCIIAVLYIIPLIGIS